MGFIYELYVIQEFRGNGISKHLMRSAMEHLQSEGYREIRLGVFAGNHAIELYKQMVLAIVRPMNMVATALARFSGGTTLAATMEPRPKNAP
ncbi:GNAT family N-acetyltransferase [Bacillus paralicheniformis]|uniref:GNAT family N-acetyltransferase n=1 Tax=Bacillus paralicheniformis TaxID=1648923 RepID=UPI0021A973B8|nr:GNAT family N-acetyltransferase [Bacillus paralicheniformis]UWS64126.1 GNAT family N-acetyltransferase [Bacillus paralicheniformis]